MDNRNQFRKIIFVSKWKLAREEVNFGNIKVSTPWKYFLDYQ